MANKEEIQNPGQIVTPMTQALAAVVVYYNELATAPHFPAFIGLKDVKLVWFSKTLENWKAMVITTLKDYVYYEVTYSGANKNTCVDVYNKIDSVMIADAYLDDENRLTDEVDWTQPEKG